MTDSRQTYAAFIKAEPPPIDGTYGDVLMVLKTSVHALEAIRNQHHHTSIEECSESENPDEAKAVQGVMQCIIVAMIHCMIKQGASTGTVEAPIVYH